MTKRLLIAGVLVLLFLGAVAYFQFVLKPEMIRGFIAQSAPPPATVTAEPVRVETWVHRITSIGTLTAIPSIEVTSQVSGIVKSVAVEGGVDVAAGDHLLQLDTAVEEADLTSNRATLRQAQLEYDRQLDLARRGTIAQQRLDEAQAARDTAQAAVERIQALIEQKSIEAPFSGRLGIRQVDLGDYVAPGNPLVSLQSLDPIYVDFPVAERYADLLQTGQRVEVTVDAFPGKVFNGQLVTLDARVSKETRTLLVRARVPNHERELMPGMFANVAIHVGEPRAVLTVPRTAISYSLYGDSVFTVQKAEAKAGEGAAPASKVERRFVRVGEVRGDRAAIIEGIGRGDVVVTSGQLKLQSGAAVQVDSSGAHEKPPERPKL